MKIGRVDRVEVEFQQGQVTEIRQARGPENVHIQVPRRLSPGQVSVRTRTWIEKTASEWSPAATWIALDRRVPPTVTVIESESWSSSVWVSSDSAPAVALVRRGDALVLRGHFPVARAADLRVRLRGPRGDLNLRPTDFGGSVRVEIPLRAASGDWRLVVETRDGRTPAQEIITIRVM